jgi:hypothetical protein
MHHGMQLTNTSLSSFHLAKFIIAACSFSNKAETTKP